MLRKGDVVYSSSGDEQGVVATGRPRVCTLEGCRGVRFAVRWQDGSLTYPCSKGLVQREDGSYQIG